MLFKNGTYGSEGFQINKNPFINKMIDPEINNKIDVPVKFRAVKEGLYKATVSLNLTKDRPAQRLSLPVMVKVMQ